MTGMAAGPTHLHGFDKRSFTQVDRYHIQEWTTVTAVQPLSYPIRVPDFAGRGVHGFSADCYVPKGLERRTIVDSKRRTNPVVPLAFA